MHIRTEITTCQGDHEHLAIVEREARSKRELQARQERQEQREQQEQREPKRQHHEKQHRKSGKSSESFPTAIKYDRFCPCSPAARPRRAVGAGSGSSVFLRFSRGFPARSRRSLGKMRAAAPRRDRRNRSKPRRTAARTDPNAASSLFQNRFKNATKNSQKSSQNGSKIAPRSLPEAETTGSAT